MEDLILRETFRFLDHIHRVKGEVKCQVKPCVSQLEWLLFVPLAARGVAHVACEAATDGTREGDGCHPNYGGYFATGKSVSVPIGSYIIDSSRSVEIWVISAPHTQAVRRIRVSETHRVVGNGQVRGGG